MHYPFFSWLGSQNGVSLLVALVALIGVLAATWWNNKKADERRKADQDAADKRRKADQAAEEARRKADDDRRERERLEQLQREDWERQRRAVADCLAIFKKEFPPLGNLYVSIPTDQDGSVMDIYIDKGIELLAFYRAIMRGLNVAELEVSNTRVQAAIQQLMESCKTEYTDLLEAEGTSLGNVGWAAIKMKAIGSEMEKCSENLVEVTKQELLTTKTEDNSQKTITTYFGAVLVFPWAASYLATRQF